MLSKCYRKKTKAGPRWLPCCRSNRPPPARTHRSCPAPSRCHGTEQLCSSPRRPELRRVAGPSSAAPPRAALLRAAPSSVCSAPRRPEMLYSPPRAALLRAAPSCAGSSLEAQTCPRPASRCHNAGPARFSEHCVPPRARRAQDEIHDGPARVRPRAPEQRPHRTRNQRPGGAAAPHRAHRPAPGTASPAPDAARYADACVLDEEPETDKGQCGHLAFTFQV